MIRTDGSAVFHRFLDLPYPSIESGGGVWLTTVDGRRVLDACSGGAMVACLGHGVRELAPAAGEQAEKISYFYNHHFTSEPQERLADRLLGLTPEMARVRFVSGGSEANETALQLARLYHVERGDTDRWRVISPAQSYHGSSMGTLALTGRPALQESYTPYLASHLHIPPSTWRTDPTGEAALAELDRLLGQHGKEIAAFFCEPVSAAALPGYSPPERFWHGLAERRRSPGSWSASDVSLVGRGAGGRAPTPTSPTSWPSVSGGRLRAARAVLVREEVYDAIDRGSREFDLGHTWHGAPLLPAVGSAVLDLIGRSDGAEGPRPRPALRRLASASRVRDREVRGRGFSGVGARPATARPSAGRPRRRMIVDDTAEHDLPTSTHPQADGFAGDQVLLAPAYTSTDAELAEMVERFAATMIDVERRVGAGLAGSPA
jgi:adenosylmethionine-8-amino-7-oxononanoate aminotransferase